MTRMPRILLSPAAPPAEDASGRDTTESDPAAMSGWMSSLPALDAQPTPAAPAADKPTKPDGAPNPTDGPAANQPPAKPGVADAAVPVPAKPAAAEPKPEPPKGDDDDTKVPRSKEDWEKWKAGRAKERSELQAKADKYEKDLKSAQERLAEAETKSQTAVEADEVKRLKALVDEMGNRIAVLDVQKDPRFEKFFGDRVKAAIDEAKSLITEPERAATLEKILSMPDSDYKTVQLNAFIDEVEDDGVKTDIRFIRRELRKIEQERSAEIQKANDRRDVLQAERKTQGEQRMKVFQQAFEKTFAALSDPKDGSAAFIRKPADEAGATEWNAQVDQRVAAAKSLMLGGKISPEDLAKASFNAVATPLILASFKQSMEQWKAKEAAYEEQIKTLTAAQPTRGTGRTAAAGKEPALDAKTVNPFDAAKTFAESFGRGMRGEE